MYDLKRRLQIRLKIKSFERFSKLSKHSKSRFVVKHTQRILTREKQALPSSEY